MEKSKLVGFNYLRGVNKEVIFLFLFCQSAVVLVLMQAMVTHIGLQPIGELRLIDVVLYHNSVVNSGFVLRLSFLSVQ